MKTLAYTTALLLLASVARADCDPNDFECGLSVANMGDAGPALKPQVVYEDTKTPKVIGTTLGIVGGLSLVATWTLYVARENERLSPRYSITQSDNDRFQALGTLGLWTGIASAGMLSASEYLLLPPSDSTPTLAWLGGAVGIGAAAVGLGFLLGGSSCAPIALRPNSDFPSSCLSGTADSMFGTTLLFTSIPLINLPLVYLFRSAFEGEPGPLTFNGRGVQWTGKF